MTSRESRVPGEPGVWIFIIGDLLVFAVLFGAFLYYRALDVETFRSSSATTDQWLGTLNTLLLLTSSWFVAGAVKLTRTDDSHRVTTFLGGGILCGLGFGAVKILEYAAKFREGVNVETNHFFMLYFGLTGLHLLHVVVGIGVLGFLLHRSRMPILNDEDRSVFEAGGVYWHMVDLLWIILFALLYLVA